MSVDYSLFRVPLEQKLETVDELLSFSTQQEIIDRLCSTLGFEYGTWEDEHLRPRSLKYLRAQDLLPPDYQQPLWATVLYMYHHENDNGRVVKYSLQDNPVICISINRAYPEDFLPVIDVLSELAPFAIVGPESVLNPEELFYFLDDWIQKNYEENELLFNYEG